MKKKNLFKIAALTAVFALGSMFANAQVTTGPDYTKQANTVLGQAGGSVKVIDNKGTVKYIQTANGLTTFTDSAPDGGIVTTFQLGGTLTNDTYIDANGKEFGIKGLDTVGTGSYQLIVTDPTTGELRRLAFDGLIQSGTHINVVGTSPAAPYVITVPVVLPTYKTIYVYRNGAKLLAGVDYNISSADPSSTITIFYNAAPGTPDYGATTGYETFPLYAGDRIEVQFIK